MGQLLWHSGISCHLERPYLTRECQEHSPSSASNQLPVDAYPRKQQVAAKYLGCTPQLEHPNRWALSALKLMSNKLAKSYGVCGQESCQPALPGPHSHR